MLLDSLFESLEYEIRLACPALGISGVCCIIEVPPGLKKKSSKGCVVVE